MHLRVGEGKRGGGRKGKMHWLSIFMEKGKEKKEDEGRKKQEERGRRKEEMERIIRVEISEGE